MAKHRWEGPEHRRGHPVTIAAPPTGQQSCALCGEPALPDDELRPVNGGVGWAHRECALRDVLGGIGHHENHVFWCTVMGDPDGGRTYRRSALEVDRWFAEHYGP